MVQRILVGFLFVAVLVLLILYSQFRVTQPFVSGIIETDEIRLGSRVGGRVKQVWVNEGDHVTANTRLLEFEPYDLLEREQQARAQLAAEQAIWKKMKAGLRDEEVGQAKARLDQLAAQLELLEVGARPEEIAAAAERLNGANAQAVLTQREYDRLANLNQANAISRTELDSAKKQYDVAISNVEIFKNELAIQKAGARPQQLDQARAQVEEARLAWELAKKGFREEDIEQAAAARDATAAVLAAIETQKSELTLVAPSAGFVDALDLQPGDLVGPNAPVLTLLSDQRMWVRTYVPQRFLRFNVGQELSITIDSFPDENFVGVVTFVSHHAEFTPSNVQTVDDRAKQVYRIRVRINDAPVKLRAGMTANVWLPSVERNSGPAHE